MTINNGESRLLKNIDEWIRLDHQNETQLYVKNIKNKYLQAKDQQAKSELIELFGHQISFGTAGLRGKMGVGFSRMNTITVQLATQGIALYLESTKSLDKISVVVGYDHRHHSYKFAQCVGKVFASRGFNVFLFGQIVPTPFIPFTVNILKANLGVMITASHNPKDDNGYKVYGSNGCQIRSPVEEQIANLIQTENRQLWDLPACLISKDPFDLIKSLYFDSTIKAFQHLFPTIQNSPKIVYTAMHGVGYSFVKDLINQSGLPPLISNESQCKPDPDFSTVKFPNPEEGQGALKLAMEKAESVNASIIFANDPDADRFNFAEMTDGNWKIFNGNEIALLLADFLWRKLRNPSRLASDYVMITSLVSSKVLERMANAEGFRFKQVATGFKNMSNAGREAEALGKQVLFAYEEAIGFMVGTNVWDKDGISALFAVYLLTIELYQNGTSLTAHLNQLASKYGYQVQFNSYYFALNPLLIPQIIEELDHKVEKLTLPITFGTRQLISVDQIEASKVIFFKFVDGSWLAIRSSGTEPKVKVYSESFVNSKQLVHEAYESLRNDILSFCDYLLNPSKNNLKLQDNI